MTLGNSDPMRILILAQQWEPEEGTPQRRWAPLIDALVRRGNKVVVVAPPPHYPGGLLTSEDPDVRTGATAKGRHGEVIVRCSFAEHDQTLRSRIWDQGVVGISTLRIARRIIDKQRPDIILTTAPPIPAAYVTSLIAHTREIPYIVDLRDVWPDLLKYLNEWASNSCSRVCCRFSGCFKSADNRPSARCRDHDHYAFIRGIAQRTRIRKCSQRQEHRLRARPAC